MQNINIFTLFLTNEVRFSKRFMYIVMWIVNSPLRAVSSPSLKGKGHRVTCHEVTEVR
jgi:hypothetical protein